MTRRCDQGEPAAAVRPWLRSLSSSPRASRPAPGYPTVRTRARRSCPSRPEAAVAIGVGARKAVVRGRVVASTPQASTTFPGPPAIIPVARVVAQRRADASTRGGGGGLSGEQGDRQRCGVRLRRNARRQRGQELIARRVRIGGGLRRSVPRDLPRSTAHVAATPSSAAACSRAVRAFVCGRRVPAPEGMDLDRRRVRW